MAGQPETLHALRTRMTDRSADSIAFDPLASDQQRQRQRAYYLANVTMIDEQVGRILERLHQRGILDNSVVLFTSDHGDSLGDHGLVEKWNMYDSSVRVPLVVWSPDRYKGSRLSDVLIQWFDIGPTILDLASAESETPMEAQSLLPFLENWHDAERRRYLFSEHAPDVMLQNVGYLYMVRDERYKLVDYRGMGEGQLFDLESDPDETVDLWLDPGHQETRLRLQRALDDWLASSTSDYAGWWLKT